MGVDVSTSCGNRIFHSVQVRRIWFSRWVEGFQELVRWVCTTHLPKALTLLHAAGTLLRGTVVQKQLMLQSLAGRRSRHVAFHRDCPPVVRCIRGRGAAGLCESINAFPALLSTEGRVVGLCWEN